MKIVFTLCSFSVAKVPYAGQTTMS